MRAERVTGPQMHPVATCHLCAPLGDRIADSAPQKPQRLRGNGGEGRPCDSRQRDGGSADVSPRRDHSQPPKKTKTKTKLITLKDFS